MNDNTWWRAQRLRQATIQTRLMGYKWRAWRMWQSKQLYLFGEIGPFEREES